MGNKMKLTTILALALITLFILTMSSLTLNTTQLSLSGIQRFLSSDTTNWIHNSEWNCYDYSLNLKQAAALKGWDFDIILLVFEGNTGHALIGTMLNNGNYVFIEPQTDEIFTDMKVGNLYRGEPKYKIDAIYYSYSNILFSDTFNYAGGIDAKWWSMTEALR